MKLIELSQACACKEVQLYSLDIGDVFICAHKLYILINKKSMNGYRVVNMGNGKIENASQYGAVLPLVKFKYEKEGFNYEEKKE